MNYNFDSRIDIDKMYLVDDFKKIDKEKFENVLKSCGFSLNKRYGCKACNMYTTDSHKATKFTIKYRGWSYSDSNNSPLFKQKYDYILNHKLDSNNWFDSLSVIDRVCIASFMCIKSDSSFINALLNSNISLKNIEQINLYLGLIKGGKLDNLDTIKLWERNVLTLANRMKLYYGELDPHIIINRANLVLTFNRDLFVRMEKEKKETDTINKVSKSK